MSRSTSSNDLSRAWSVPGARTAASKSKRAPEDCTSDELKDEGKRLVLEHAIKRMRSAVTDEQQDAAAKLFEKALAMNGDTLGATMPDVVFHYVPHDPQQAAGEEAGDVGVPSESEQAEFASH